MSSLAMLKIMEQQNQALRDERDRLREALEQLARLGNEPYYGNSVGNKIAQKALGIDPSADIANSAALTPAGGGKR